MKTIGITQRIDRIDGRCEWRDALDGRWAPLLEALGLRALPVPNGLVDVIGWATALGLQGLLLSGGNDVSGSLHLADQLAPARDRTEAALLDLAQAQRWPVLGVCRGMQLLNQHLGGGLVELAGHVATRHALRAVPDGEPGAVRSLVDGLDGLDAGPGEVNSYHQFGLAPTGLAPALRPWLIDDEGHVEAVEHRQLRWVGVLWHPEREPVLSAFDSALIRAIFEIQ